MRMSVFLVGVTFTTILALVCLMAVLVYLDPSSIDVLTISLFYLSLFVSVSGTLSLIGLVLRRLSRKSRSTLSVNRQLWDSFRQGILLAFILTGTLILQSKSLMTWWSLIVLVGIVGMIEYLCMR